MRLLVNSKCGTHEFDGSARRVRVQVVQHNVGVAAVAGGEDDDLEVFAKILKDFFGVGTDVDSSLDHFSSWKGNGKLNIERRSKGVIAMD